MFEQIKRELMRLRGELVALAISFAIFLIVGISRANFEVIIFKLAVVAMASTVAHILRQLVFDYVCLEDCIFGEERFKDVPPQIRAAVTVGIFLVYASVVYAVVVAA